MSAEEGAVTAGVGDRAGHRVPRRADVATAAFWLLGSAVVVLAQPGSDRKLAAVCAAVAGIATILLVDRLTHDPSRRYFRSLVGAMVVVSVVGDVLVLRLTGNTNGFQVYGLDTRIALPLIFVLLAPLVLQALPVQLRSRGLWSERALLVREARPMDWLAVAYGLLVLPDLALGLAHHAPKTYIAQDLGLIVFFLFAYVVGRTIGAETGRAASIELVGVLLALAAAHALFGWDTTPIFTYAEAACAGAVAFTLLRPRKTQLVTLALALAFLGADAVAVMRGAGSTRTVELAAGLGVIAYLVVRTRDLVPQWAVVGLAAVAAGAFLFLTSDGATVQGRYHGQDQSNLGRAYEAHQVLEASRGSAVSFVFGRGLGGSIDETEAPPTFAQSLVFGGRDLAHVQEVHLLPYEFMLKYGLLGFAWLAAFVVAVAILGVRALEKASRGRDPTLVVYAALPLLGIAAALAAATHLQDNPLNAFAVGVLVTRLDRKPVAVPALRLAVPAAAVVFAAVGAVAFTRPLGSFFPEAANPLPLSATVGDVQVSYPKGYDRRFIKTASDSGPGAHRKRVQGVVIASYPLKRNAELGGSGERLRPGGVFFELSRTPVRGGQPKPAARFPMTIFDLTTVRSLLDTATTEQGGIAFSVNGRNYRAILWVGKGASKPSLLTVDYLIGSIRLKGTKATG